ncbi:MAG TPA: tetratricopeptide repeat protein, partial [Polyangiaceae bacterium]
RGLDRVYGKLGRWKELASNLELQIELAATPRQKIALLERAAALHGEEFLDHAKAADCLDRLLAIDPEHSGALARAVRHARALERWEKLSELHDLQIKTTESPWQKVPLLLERARVLAGPLDSAERASAVYEAVLEIDPAQPEALEALAKLRESTGDAERAVKAIEALAQTAQDPESRAEQWIRAAKLLEARGDRDGAIERYKRALDANPKDAVAAARLRDAYTARGDVAATIQLLEREIEQTEGNLARGALLGQLCARYREGLRDDKRAEECAKRALALDPTNISALTVLGDVAFDDGRFLEASKYYEALAERKDAVDRSVLGPVLIRYAEALSHAGSSEKAVQPMEMLLRLSPEDPAAVRRAAEIIFRHGSPARAAELYADLAERFSAELSQSERAQALYRLGEARRAAGLHADAIAPLEEAADLDPASPLPLVALAKAHEAQEAWAEAIKIKLRHLDLANGDERVQLLLDVAELSGTKLGDRTQAAKSLVAALDERPDDRRLLTKLMQLYSEEKDWSKLVEVVLRLADFVDDPKQRVKYLHTAAIVTARQIGDTERALEFYEQVLELEPTFDKAIAESAELWRKRGDHAAVERLLRRKLELATRANDQAEMIASFDELGELYEKNLGWTDQAIDAFEAARTLDPTNAARGDRLRALYATEPERYLDKAVQSELEILRADPYRAEPYRAMRRLYTEAKRADEAWCLCQALTVIGLAEPDEERFFKRLRSDTAAPAQSALDDEAWLAHVMHPEADPLLTSVFALIEPAVVARRSAGLAELGYDEGWLVNVEEHAAPVCQSLYYAGGVLGIAVPPCFENPNDPGGVSFLFAQEPSLVLGVTALRPDVPLRVAAFIAAHKLAYLRPGMYVRHLLASGTALKAWLFAAIKLTSPTFPVAPELEGAVNEAVSALDSLVQGQARDHLTRVVAKLLTSGAALDLKRWVAAVDLTADRAGFLVSHDLMTALEVIRASEEGVSALPIEDRVKELVSYSVSPDYLELRRRLVITVDS